MVFTGVRFAPGYADVSASHKLYGSFRRLNARLGDDKVPFFLEGRPGAEVDVALLEAAQGSPGAEGTPAAAPVGAAFRARALESSTVGARRERVASARAPVDARVRRF